MSTLLCFYRAAVSTLFEEDVEACPAADYEAENEEEEDRDYLTELPVRIVCYWFVMWVESFLETGLAVEE